MTFEEFTQEALTYLGSKYIKSTVDNYKDLLLKQAKEYYDSGYTPRLFVDWLIRLSADYKPLKCPICGKELTRCNSNIREEIWRYYEGTEDHMWYRSFYYTPNYYKTFICNKCDSKLSTRRFLLKTLVLFIAIGVPVGGFFLLFFVVRLLKIDSLWLGGSLFCLYIFAALLFFWYAMLGHRFTEKVGNYLKRFFGPYRVEKEDAVGFYFPK